MISRFLTAEGAEELPFKSLALLGIKNSSFVANGF